MKPNRLIGSRAIAHALGYRPDAVRAWRQAGHLDGIGRIRSGDMTYADDDIALLATATHLITIGWRHVAAFDFVRLCRQEICGALDNASSGIVTITLDAVDPTSALVVKVRDLAEHIAAKAHEFERRHAA